MRPLWKDAVTFGLMAIPVSLFPATRREELKFRQLQASDQSPVNYKRVAEADGKEVPWDQIVKGYEYEEGTVGASGELSAIQRENVYREEKLRKLAADVILPGVKRRRNPGDDRRRPSARN